MEAGYSDRDVDGLEIHVYVSLPALQALRNIRSASTITRVLVLVNDEAVSFEEGLSLAIVTQWPSLPVYDPHRPGDNQI